MTIDFFSHKNDEAEKQSQIFSAKQSINQVYDYFYIELILLIGFGPLTWMNLEKAH